MLGGDRAVKQMGLDAAPAAKHEYGSNSLTLELVRSMDEAVSHIHTYGSGHTEAIITGAPFLFQACCTAGKVSAGVKAPLLYGLHLQRLPKMLQTCAAWRYREIRILLAIEDSLWWKTAVRVACK